MRVGVRRIDPCSQEEKAFCADAFCRGIVSSRRFDTNSAPLALSLYRDVFDYLYDNSIILVAVDEDDSDRFVGFISYSQKEAVVYYVYIKRHYRNRGYATALVNGVREDMGGRNPLFAVQTQAMTTLAKRWRVLVDESALYRPYFTKKEGKGKEDENSTVPRTAPASEPTEGNPDEHSDG